MIIIDFIFPKIIGIGIVLLKAPITTNYYIYWKSQKIIIHYKILKHVAKVLLFYTVPWERDPFLHDEKMTLFNVFNFV